MVAHGQDLSASGRWPCHHKAGNGEHARSPGRPEASAPRDPGLAGRDAQPELAWRYDPLLDGSRRRRRSVFETTGLPPRPLRLLCRPISLRSKSTAPDGPPLLFQLRNREHRVAQSWGPERIETGWWRGQVIGRDYYRIETVDGRRFWLFRRLRDGRWFLHGVFE